MTPSHSIYLLLIILSSIIGSVENSFCPRYCKCNSFLPGRDSGLFNDPSLFDMMKRGQVSIVTYFHGSKTTTNREMKHIVCWGLPSLPYVGLPADISSFVIRGNFNLYPTTSPNVYQSHLSKSQYNTDSTPSSINMHLNVNMLKTLTSQAPHSVDHVAIMNDKDFPQAKTVKRLELRNLNLTVIRPNMFQHLTNLQTLSLTDSKVEILSSRSFSGLWNLKELQLSNNSIKQLPESLFLYVANLRRLYLNGNKLMYVSELHFSALSHMLELDLSNNQISRISAAAFAKLYHIQVLNLDNNKIQSLQFQWFQHMNHLRKITLKGNQFAKIGDQQFFNIPHLNTLDVSHNHIQSVNHIPKPQSLQTLSLAHNNITELNKNSFSDNDNLEKLNLNNNKIQHIDSQTFVGMVKLTELSLSHNALTTIDNGALQPLKKLQKLHLSYNKIGSLPSRVFYGLTELKELHLENNLIHTLHEEVFSVAFMNQLSKLAVIYLQHNRIKLIKAYTFYGAPNIKVLNISHNNLQTIEDKGFMWMNHLQTLDLKINQLTLEEGRPFFKNKNLENLNLANNQIKQLHTNVFVGLDNLNELDLNNNEIAIIPKNILPSSVKLQRLSLQYNQIQEFRFDSINNQNLIKDLNLANNKISSIHTISKLQTKIEVLALENNTLQSLPWDLEKYLSPGAKITMKNNPWKCDCFLHWITKTTRENKTVIEDKNETLCNLPEHLKGEQLFNLSTNDLTCHTTVTKSFPPDKQSLSGEKCGSTSNFLLSENSPDSGNVKSVKKMLLEWHATIYDLDKVPVCSGVLLSDQWLLTTEFCWKLVMTSTDFKRFEIHVGETKRFKIDLDNADLGISSFGEQSKLSLLKIKQIELNFHSKINILFPDVLCSNQLQKVLKLRLTGTVGAHAINSGNQVQSITVRVQSKCRIPSSNHACVVTLNRNILSNAQLFILSGAAIFVNVTGAGWKLLGISEQDVWDRNLINTILVTDYLRQNRHLIQ